MPKIWIDADACPQAVKQVVFKASERTNIPCILVANSFFRVPSSEYITLKVVSKGMDVADTYIVEHSESQDLVITADIPLADLLVKKKCLVINPRGKVYTEANIKESLSVRNFLDEMRGAGQVTGGPAQYGKKDLQSFANSFDRLLTMIQS